MPRAMGSSSHRRPPTDELRSADHGKHAEVMGVPKTLPATGNPETPEHDYAIGCEQRPAILGGPERETIRDAPVTRIAASVEFECCGLVS
jgi:hypothetical protein